MGKSSGIQAQPAVDPKAATEADLRSRLGTQITPLGTQASVADPSSVSGYTTRITLPEEAQRTLTNLLANYQTMSGKAGQALSNFDASPMDLSSIQDVADKTYGYQTARLDPQWDTREEALRTRLRNQGLVPGGEANTNEMRDFNAARNDAYTQARLAAESTKQPTFQLASAIKNQPLDYYAALMNQAPVQMPQFTPQQGANYLGAAQQQNQWNQYQQGLQAQEQNSMMSGLFQLGGSALGGYFGGPWGAAAGGAAGRKLGGG